MYERLLAVADEHKREVNVNECSADLAKEHRAKTVACGTSSAASPTTLLAIPSGIDNLTDAADSSAVIPTPVLDSTIPAETTPEFTGLPESSPADLPALARSALGLSSRPLFYPGDTSAQEGPHFTAQDSVTHTITAHTSTWDELDRPMLRQPPRPQHLRAYQLWHHRDMPLPDMCATLRSRDNPLAESTVM